jgi:hypothetical protein
VRLARGGGPVAYPVPVRVTIGELSASGLPPISGSWNGRPLGAMATVAWPGPPTFVVKPTPRWPGVGWRRGPSPLGWHDPLRARGSSKPLDASTSSGRRAATDQPLALGGVAGFRYRLIDTAGAELTVVPYAVPWVREAKPSTCRTAAA